MTVLMRAPISASLGHVVGVDHVEFQASFR